MLPGAFTQCGTDRPSPGDTFLTQFRESRSDQAQRISPCLVSERYLTRLTMAALGVWVLYSTRVSHLLPASTRLASIRHGNGLHYFAAVRAHPKSLRPSGGLAALLLL